MREAVIVSAARTPIGKAYRGAYNKTAAPTLASYSIKEAVDRAGIDPKEVEDVVMGCAQQQGTQAINIGRLSGIAAGLPDNVPGMTIDRQCSSGMMAIATASKQVITDNMDIVVAGGVESISLVQTAEFRVEIDPNVTEHAQHAYMPMIETADHVAEKYNVTRESQDEYSLQSQQRTAAAQEAELYKDEIISTTTTKLVKDKESGEISEQEATLEKERLQLDKIERKARKAELPKTLISGSNKDSLLDLSTTSSRSSSKASSSKVKFIVFLEKILLAFSEYIHISRKNCNRIENNFHTAL